MSTLLGRQAMTSDYLSLGGSESKEHAESGLPFEELVSKLEKILEEPAQLSQAQGIWASWLNTEETKHRKRGQEFRELLSEPTVKRLLGTVFGAALTEMEHDRDDAPKRIERTGRYAPRIVKDLLQRRLLTDAMWPGGVVVGALLPCGDWVGLCWPER